jgi:hypothetical protein
MSRKKEPAVVGVMDDNVGFVGVAAEIADSERLPLGSDAAHRACADNLARPDIEVFEVASVAVANDQIGFVRIAGKVARGEGLPLKSHRARRIHRQERVVAKVANRERTCAGAACHPKDQIGRCTRRVVGSVVMGNLLSKGSRNDGERAMCATDWMILLGIRHRGKKPPEALKR